MSFNRGESQTLQYLALDPEGKAPAPMIDGRPLTEVAAILFYHGRRFPEARLLPESVEDEARVVSWTSFTASTLRAARRQVIERGTAIYQIADRRLAGQDWAVERYSVADIHLFRLFWRFNASLRPQRARRSKPFRASRSYACPRRCLAHRSRSNRQSDMSCRS